MKKIVLLACMLALFASAAVLVGCGSGGSSGANTPEGVAEAFNKAAVKRDADTTWNLMSVEGHRVMESKSAWAKVLKDAGNPTSFKVGKATINGNTATVEMTYSLGGKTSTSTLTLVKEDGVWKMEPTQ